jgi:hypothetical protein
MGLKLKNISNAVPAPRYAKTHPACFCKIAIELLQWVALLRQIELLLISVAQEKTKGEEPMSLRIIRFIGLHWVKSLEKSVNRFKKICSSWDKKIRCFY